MKDRGGVFDWGLIPQCTLCFMFSYTFLTFFLFLIDKNLFSLFSFQNINQSETRIGDLKLSVELYV